MTQLIDLKALAKGLVGLADIFSRLAKSIEDSIKSGLRSADVVRRTRERRRLRNMMKITAHLYVTQGSFTSTLQEFVDVASDERGTWETAKFEILEIRRLLDQLDRYVLPYSDALMIRHRRQYLELLEGIGQRRKLLNAVYQLEYEDAIKNRKTLSDIGKAYVKLQEGLRELMYELATADENGNTLLDAVGLSNGPLELLDKPPRTRGKAVQREGPSTSGTKRKRSQASAANRHLRKKFA
jgi:hypothetical protein